MTEQLTDVPVESRVESAKPILSSRTSRAAAGWVDCQKAASTTELFRTGYTPRSFSWISPRPLWESRNDRIARWFGDPTDVERERWVAAMRKKPVDADLIVRRYADRETLSFIVLGDPGEGDASQYHLLRPLKEKADGIAFTFICSDVIYPAGDVNEYYDKFYWPYQSLPGPIYAIPGNHDWYDGLHGFMAHFCQADPDDRPPVRSGGIGGRLREFVWRKPSKPDQERLEEMAKLRAERSDQPGPYFAVDGPVMLVGIDTGIKGNIDDEQGAWLERISRLPKSKILLTGKPLVVDAMVKTIKIGNTGKTVNAIVADPANRYVAVIGGDIHNFQRYPVKLADGRTVQHIVSGAAGAYTKATHNIPKIDEKLGCSEDDFRCYPRRGDSLAAYSRLYDRRFRGKGKWVVPYEQAPKIMSAILEGHEPTRESDKDVEVTPQAWKAAKRIARLPGSAAGFFHQNFSELLDWNDPPPPLFKSFLRLELNPGEIRIRCFAATGCEEHQDNPPLEDSIRGREQADGTWSWEVLLD